MQTPNKEYQKTQKVSVSIKNQGMSCCLLFALGISLLTGCTTSSLKIVEPKPAKLKKLTNNQSHLKSMWLYNVDQGSKKDTLKLQVAVTNNAFFVAGRQGHIVKLALDGKPVWSKKTADNISSGVTTNESIAVVTDDQGIVHAFEQSNGKQRWKYKLNSLVLAPALMTTNRVVLSANNGMVVGLDTNSGQPVWQFKTSAPKFSLRGTAKPVQVSQNVAVVAGADGRIHAFNINSGLPLWVRRVAMSSGRSDFDKLIDIDADPVLSQSTLYTAGFQSHVVAIDMVTGKQTFQKKLSSIKTLAVDDKSVFVVTTNGQIVALDANTGAQKWQQNSLEYRKLSNPVVIGEYVFVGDYQGYVHTINTRDGKIIGRIKASKRIIDLQKNGKQLLTQTNTGEYSVWQVQ